MNYLSAGCYESNVNCNVWYKTSRVNILHVVFALNSEHPPDKFKLHDIRFYLLSLLRISGPTISN